MPPTTPEARRVWTFALSWAIRWYQAVMMHDATWLVLLGWVVVWFAKKYKRDLQALLWALVWWSWALWCWAVRRDR